MGRLISTILYIIFNGAVYLQHLLFFSHKRMLLQCYAPLVLIGASILFLLLNFDFTDILFFILNAIYLVYVCYYILPVPYNLVITLYTAVLFVGIGFYLIRNNKKDYKFIIGVSSVLELIIALINQLKFTYDSNINSVGYGILFASINTLLCYLVKALKAKRKKRKN